MSRVKRPILRLSQHVATEPAYLHVKRTLLLYCYYFRLLFMILLLLLLLLLCYILLYDVILYNATHTNYCHYIIMLLFHCIIILFIYTPELD